MRPSPVRSPALPKSVQINISKAASLTLSDFEVRRSIYIALSNKNSKDINITHKLVVDIKVSPAAKLTSPDRAVGPATLEGLDCDNTKNGRLPTTRAPRAPISITSQLDGLKSTTPHPRRGSSSPEPRNRLISNKHDPYPPRMGT
jgi:hypothetical protein